ncbi:MAG: hypothetical protein ACK5Z2_11055 [Bacteroidota bacterium]|jgi:hypothetical protein
MENNRNEIESLFDRMTQYLKLNAELLKLKLLDASASIASVAALSVLIIAFGAIILVFVNIGLALLISEKMENSWAGFFIIGAGYCLILLLVLLFKKQIKSAVRNVIITTASK